MEVPEPGSQRGARATFATPAGGGGAQLPTRSRRESDKEEEVAEENGSLSARVSCDRNSVRLESGRRQRRWGLGPSLHRRSGGGWAAKCRG